MSEYQAYAETSLRPMPDSVRTLRVLLYVWTALTLLITVGFLLSQEVTAESLGALVWSAWPGIAAYFIARGIKHGGRKRYWATVVVGAFGVLAALGSIGAGDPRGVTQLILPVAVLVAVTRPAARAFFKD